MAKTKTARLSLTLPNPVQVAGNEALSPKPEGIGGPGTSDDPRRKESTAVAGRQRDDVLVHIDSFKDALPTMNSFTGHSSANLPHPSGTPTSPAVPLSPKSPTFTSLPPYPTSPQHTPRHAHNSSKSFFANMKASKSSVKIQSPESTIRKVSNDSEDDEMVRKLKSTSSLGRKPAVDLDVPALPLSGANGQPSSSITQISQPSLVAIDDHAVPYNSDASSPRPPVAGPAVSSKTPIFNGADVQDGKKKDSSMLSNLMKRNHSNRNEEVGHASRPPTSTTPSGTELNDLTPVPRNRPTHRNPSPHSDPGVSDGFGNTESRALGPQLNNQRSQNFREGGSNLFNRAKKAAGGIGKAGNRLFKNKEPDPEPERPAEPPVNYHCTVITQDLVRQTRITRIARRLEDSKDKTEFWMPALPWRCIDYLNFKGCEVEGLYRVPGSEVQVRFWKWKFDTEHDVNLLEEEELYDVNIIGSLFKAWLRGLPDELLPKATQDKLTEYEGDSLAAPQALRDELSLLPPWNYYLLFAITCHLSLLHAYVETNKMTYQNLFICFAPALKMNGDCFRWLVTDWRNCWGQGCWTEKDSLEEEYRILDHMEPRFENELLEPHAISSEDRSLSSSGSGTTNSRPPALDLTQPQDDSRLHANSNAGHNRNPSQLPELTLPQPISPFYNTEHIQ
ncbi:hypothetical protein MMC13_003363 [Lambiella insularis]|nr:hypothetical protein [Lambiella insularis]